MPVCGGRWNACAGRLVLREPRNAKLRFGGMNVQGDLFNPLNEKSWTPLILPNPSGKSSWKY
jgi:ABC-type branched-subunit amino acid transport system ATPase component